MLLPTLACPASCVYCFGPHADGPSMQQETLDAIVRWQNALGSKDALEITFHGGEPLLPGTKFYRMALPLLRNGLFPRKTHFAVQSNLWLLTDELCELFQEYNVSIGTSLDGPEEINDAQRGKGYFQRTFAGIERTRAHGIDVGCICTFTAQSAPHAQDIFDFFLREGMGFSIHAALPALTHLPIPFLSPKWGRKGAEGVGEDWTLSPEAHSQLLVDMLDRYLANVDKIRISTLDAMCRSVSAGRGGICTFGDCLGKYMAVDPEGWIYSCQRFAGMPQYRLGNVHDCPSLETLSATPAWQMFQERQECIAQECGDCAHLDFCRGGCPYNVLVASGGHFNGTLHDPHCPAYKRVLSAITDRAMEQVFSEQNLEAVATHGPGKYGLLRKGKLLHIMRGGPHPQKVAGRARKVVAAVTLAASLTAEEAVAKLDRAGLVTRPDLALQSLSALQAQLRSQSQSLVNAYIHVTYICNLACDHCYASSGPRRTGQAMSVEDMARLVREAAQAGFGKAIITGGEPMVHPQRDALLDALADLRQTVKPLQIVLRTNLTYALTPTLIEMISRSADEIIVSVDGDQASHDARRGAGTYARMAENLRLMLKTVQPKQIALAATLTAAQVHGREGQAVSALGQELGVAVCFRPLRPLGRAVALALQPDSYTPCHENAESLAQASIPRATCGLGLKLPIGVNGDCYPCFALETPRNYLGNVFKQGGIAGVIGSKHYQAIKQITVDSNRQCRQCALRYLCGGFCRVWSSSDDPDAPPTDCTALHERARGLLLGALEALDVPVERWLAAGLPLPISPPTK